MALPASSGRPQQSILTLDKSKEPFPSQVATVCEILEISLDSVWRDLLETGGHVIQQQNTTSDPRPEWALRWLLKKFEASEVVPGSPCLFFKSWLLLCELAVRAPLAKTAALLKTYKFTTILRKTLQWFCENVDRSLPEPVLEEGASPEKMDTASDMLESSSIEPETSKKRKRDGAEVPWPQKERKAIAGAVDTAYLALWAAIAQLQALAKDVQRTRGFAVEHIKSALRSSPEEAARILGTTLYVTNYLVQEPKKRSEQRSSTSEPPKPLESTAYEYCIASVVGVWNNRAVPRQESNAVTSSNHAFRSHCLLPALQLLGTWRERLSSVKNIGTVTSSLQDLLVKHVIIPFRTSCLDPEQPTPLQTAGSPTPFAEDLVTALRSYQFPKPAADILIGKGVCEAESLASKTQAHITVTFLSLLFEIALNNCPRNTPKMRRTEDPWLEGLFLQLATCAKSTLPTVTTHRDYARLLRWMLQNSIDQKLRLSLSTIEVILEQASGLLSDEPGDLVKWSVISLCLQIDANAFIVPASTGKLDTARSSRPPNRFLSALLSKVTDQNLEANRDYDLVLNEVVIRLCSAFSDARDLTGFIGHWQEQISTIQQRRKLQENFIAQRPSIWEDEKLFQSIASLVESALTAGQIQQLLSSAATDLAVFVPDVPNDVSISLSSLVILDCLFAGVSQEDTVSKLAETAQSAFSLLGALLSGSSTWLRRHRWRMWRVLATITARWVTLHVSASFKLKARTTICMASEMINGLTPESSLAEGVDLAEELHAFTFMLQFTTMEEFFWEGLDFSSRSTVGSAVQKILDAMGPFCYRISHDHFQTIKSPDSVPIGDEFDTRVRPLRSLYLGCVAGILTSPHVLKYLDFDIQFRLIEQLYWCALYQRRLSHAMPRDSIDYSWPWTMLFRSEILVEHASTARCLRKFLVDHYLSISNFGDAKYSDSGIADYTLAFESILTIPLQVLERGYRSVIANRILRILCAKMPRVATTANHVTMLVKLLAMPNKSMDILVNTRETPNKDSAKVDEEVTLIKLARDIDGVTGWSSDNGHSVTALRRLTRSVMSYLFSTADQRSSLDYLQIFYDQLKQLLEFKYNNKELCTTTFSAVVGESLNAYSKNRKRLSGSLEAISRTLDTTRLYHLEIILSRFEHGLLIETPEQRHDCDVNLECIAEYIDLLGIHPNLRQISIRLFGSDGVSGRLKMTPQNVHDGEATAPKQDNCGLEYLAARLAKIEFLLDAGDSKLHPNILHLSRQIDGVICINERNNLLGSLKQTMPILRLQSKIELYFEYDVDATKSLTYSELYLAGSAFASLEEGEVEELQDTLSRLFIIFCRGLVESTTFRECMITMQCISMLMQKHPRIITQWHMDNLLSAITGKSCFIEEQSNEKQSAMLFIGLCRLFGSILTIHRMKIGGRYHIVILALQSLLRCLFTPYQTAASNTDTHSALTETHAAAYARLLTTLCEPTVSSVTRSKRRPRLELNDETKKAKSIAGQHLPYLITEYCSCQLRGRLLPEMKAALNPGLHAVLAVMTQEVMRTMNAALDESGRAIWKALYEDYRRLGRSGGG